jgi:hypothetical protein
MKCQSFRCVEKFLDRTTGANVQDRDGGQLVRRLA